MKCHSQHPDCIGTQLYPGSAAIDARILRRHERAKLLGHQIAEAGTTGINAQDQVLRGGQGMDPLPDLLAKIGDRGCACLIDDAQYHGQQILRPMRP